MGRFITKDPIGFAGGMNLYGYVLNNPANSTDPFGLELPEWYKKYKQDVEDGVVGQCRDEFQRHLDMASEGECPSGLDITNICLTCCQNLPNPYSGQGGCTVTCEAGLLKKRESLEQCKPEEVSLNQCQ